ncbi:hypothetical protein D3C87_1852430 [compost metagenome]
MFLQIPVDAEEHQNVASVLQVQTVPRTGRVGEHDRDLSCVPRVDRLGLRIKLTALRESRHEPRQVAFKVIRDEYRHTCGFL